MTILAISPHSDDVEFGAGATLARFVDEGRTVCVLTLSYCEESVPSGFPKDALKHEQAESFTRLGIHGTIGYRKFKVRHFPEHRQAILEELVQARKAIKPDLVLCPCSSDTHQDHATIRQEAFRAFKHTASIWGYESPWNTDPNLPFAPNIYSRVDPAHFKRKWHALQAYESQAFREYMNEEFVLSMLALRGAEAGVGIAEAFEAIRIMA